MVKISMPEYKISVNQLRAGVFIRLEKTNWFDHPFLFNKFKVKDEEHVSLLRNLGITDVFCIPEKSDVLPLRPADQRKPERDEDKKLDRKSVV